MINYTIYLFSSDQTLIAIKGQVIEIGISRVTFMYYVIKQLFDETNLKPFYDIIG